MKKVLVVFILLMLVVPAMATITVTATCSGTVSPYTVTVAYTASATSEVPRAFGLLISCDANGTIGTVTPNTASYYVAPGTFNYNGTTVTTWGNPIVPVVAGKSFILEVGSLYASNDTGGHTTQPALTGTLLTFPLTVPTGKSNVTIAVDAARGGVVKEDATAAAATLTGCTCPSAPSECVKSTAGVIYTNWVAVGKPNCWCFQRNCRGDADGIKSGLYWVGTLDLTCLRAGFNRGDSALFALPQCATGPGGISIKPVCADFDHIKSGLYRVATSDLTTLRLYFNKGASSVPVCDMTNYNFWTN